MHQYQRDFIEFALDKGVLRFGEFKLKSGRISPYFFNAGLFNTGSALARLGKFYAAAINQSGLDFDLMLGPAYKGIPLVSATVIALAEHYSIDVPYLFNRKETKNHGEGGQLVGAELKGRVLIIDDVITAGTAIREVMSLINQYDATPAGVAIALDRQEKGLSDMSAIQEVERDYGIPVVSIITLADLITYLKETEQSAELVCQIEGYREKYGV